MFKLIILTISLIIPTARLFAAPSNLCVAGVAITCNSGYKVSGSSCIPCNGCASCDSDSFYSDVSGKNYQSRTTRTCNCETCQSSTSYRCKSGYFGTSQSCTSCATATGNSAATSIAGMNTLITQCQLSEGYGQSDTTGSWTYSSACYYQN
ncbi:MAG: solute carrier organic anion transporter [Rickettsiales bacterium]|nr:solute carrier organic anion transporter [Rickettsiales bacterium]